MTAVRVVVQASPRRSVTTNRRAAQLVARGEVGHLCAFEYSAPAMVELAGRPSLDRRFVRVGGQLVDGLGRRGGRLWGRGLVEFLVGELVLEGLSDQAGAPRPRR